MRRLVHKPQLKRGQERDDGAYADAEVHRARMGNPNIQGEAISQSPRSRFAHSSQFAKAMMAASEIAAMSAPLTHKFIFPDGFVSAKSQGAANSTIARSRLYKSRTDSGRHIFMGRSPAPAKFIGQIRTNGKRAGVSTVPRRSAALYLDFRCARPPQAAAGPA